VPLVRREDSVLVVVDAQPGFFAYDGLSQDDARRAADAVTRIAWMAGLAALLDILNDARRRIYTVLGEDIEADETGEA